MNCPRRINEIGPWIYEENDSDYWDNEQCCSFCGSVKPSRVIELLKEGCSITKTDKNYKLYIEGKQVPRGKGMAKVYLQHFSQEDTKQLNELLGLRS